MSSPRVRTARRSCHLFSQQDQKPYLNQAEVQARGGEKAEWKKVRTREGRLASQRLKKTRSLARPPFIDTKLFVNSIVSFLHDVAVLVSPGVGRQMAVVLRASLPVVSLCAWPDQTPQSSSSEQRVSGAEPVVANF